MGNLVLPAEERLAAFRESSRVARESMWRDVLAGMEREHGVPVKPIGGGAPSPQTNLAVMRNAVTNNTFTTDRSIIGTTAGVPADTSGPFSADWFNVNGAMWEMEAMGVISSVSSCTWIWQTKFDKVVPTSSSTSLATTGTITATANPTNVDWYYLVMGRTISANGAASTTLCTGYLQAQIVTAAANNIITYVKNATPPTAITTDWSLGSVFLDLRVTCGTSSSSNTITTNFYRLSTLLS